LWVRPIGTLRSPLSRRSTLLRRASCVTLLVTRTPGAMLRCLP